MNLHTPSSHTDTSVGSVTADYGQEVRPISGAGANFLFLTSRCIVPPPC